MVSRRDIASKVRRLARGLGVMLLLASNAPAQTAVTNGGSRPQDGDQLPARIGNVYDHQDHQPTQAEEAAAGIAPPSSSTKREVEKEVEELLQQTDRLDKQADELEQNATRVPGRD